MKLGGDFSEVSECVLRVVWDVSENGRKSCLFLHICEGYTFCDRKNNGNQ